MHSSILIKPDRGLLNGKTPTNLLHVNGDNDANQHPDRGDDAQDGHVEHNAALFQSCTQSQNTLLVIFFVMLENTS